MFIFHSMIFVYFIARRSNQPGRGLPVKLYLNFFTWSVLYCTLGDSQILQTVPDTIGQTADWLLFGRRRIISWDKTVFFVYCLKDGNVAGQVSVSEVPPFYVRKCRTANCNDCNPEYWKNQNDK